MKLNNHESRPGPKGPASHLTNDTLTEAEAIRRSQEGDATAFEFLYKSHSAHVYGVCLRMLKNTSDAEDLTQQVFLVVFRRIVTFRGDSSFSTWLHRVTLNAALMHLRSRKPSEELTDSLDTTSKDGDHSHEPSSVDLFMLGAIDRVNLQRAICQLPSGCKRLFLLHDVIGFRHAEIANLVGCTIGCSKSQVHKARKRLRNLLHGKPDQVEIDVACA